MMGVLPAYRNKGVGRMLKLRQREEALERGVNLIEWTFDPLELKNAFFNIERLGAIVRRYVLNQYGMTASPLHGGLPTDRCVAEWHMDTPRVDADSWRASASEAKIEARIEVPYAISPRWRVIDPRAGREIQQRDQRKVPRAFRSGLGSDRLRAQR